MMWTGFNTVWLQYIGARKMGHYLQNGNYCSKSILRMCDIWTDIYSMWKLQIPVIDEDGPPSKQREPLHQVTSQYNASTALYISEHTVLCTLHLMGLCNHWPTRLLLLLTPWHWLLHLIWVKENCHWIMKDCCSD